MAPPRYRIINGREEPIVPLARPIENAEGRVVSTGEFYLLALESGQFEKTFTGHDLLIFFGGDRRSIIRKTQWGLERGIIGRVEREGIFSFISDRIIERRVLEGVGQNWPRYRFLEGAEERLLQELNPTRGAIVVSRERRYLPGNIRSRLLRAWESGSGRVQAMAVLEYADTQGLSYSQASYELYLARFMGILERREGGLYFSTEGEELLRKLKGGPSA